MMVQDVFVFSHRIFLIDRNDSIRYWLSRNERNRSNREKIKDIRMKCYVLMEVQMPWRVWREFHGFAAVERHVELFSIRCFVLIVQYQDSGGFWRVH